MKIIDIKFLKNNRIKIISDKDKEFIISQDIYIQMPLQKGQELDDEEENFFKDLIIVDKCYQQSMRYINHSYHSKGLLCRKLRLKHIFAEETITKTIERLENLKYIDDEKFCQLFIEQKCKKIDWGEFRIKQKLVEYGLEKNIIEKFMNTTYNSSDEEFKKIEKMFDKKWKTFRKKDFFTKKLKVINFLKTKGFKTDMVWEVVNKKLIDKENEDSFNSY